MLTIILASLASGAIGAFVVYRFYAPRLGAKVKVSLSAELLNWETGADQWITRALEQTKNEATLNVVAEIDGRFMKVERALKNQAETYAKGTAERLRKAFDEQLNAKKTELEDFVQTELGNAVVALTEEKEPKLEGVTPDKPKTTEEEEKQKSRGVEGTFCM